MPVPTSMNCRTPSSARWRPIRCMQARLAIIEVRSPGQFASTVAAVSRSAA